MLCSRAHRNRSFVNSRACAVFSRCTANRLLSHADASATEPPIAPPITTPHNWLPMYHSLRSVYFILLTADLLNVHLRCVAITSNSETRRDREAQGRKSNECDFKGVSKFTPPNT